MYIDKKVQYLLETTEEKAAGMTYSERAKFLAEQSSVDLRTAKTKKPTVETISFESLGNVSASRVERYF